MIWYCQNFGRSIHMHNQIIWSLLSEDDFAGILEYLENEWGDKVALQFIEILDQVLYQICISPKQFPVIFKKEKIRKSVLTKHNTLFYRFSRSQIDVLRIYDTR